MLEDGSRAGARRNIHAAQVASVVTVPFDSISRNLSSCEPTPLACGALAKLLPFTRFGQNLADPGDWYRHGHVAIAAGDALRFEQRIINSFLSSLRSCFK